MNRRTYVATVLGVASTTAIAGCLQGEAVLHETQISATSETKEWEVDLEEGNRMRLEVEKTDDSPGSISGHVSRAETGEEIASTSDSRSDETFEVPATGTYVVSADPRGATGEIILRDLD
jgi:Neuraminidase (sialidase)